MLRVTHQHKERKIVWFCAAEQQLVSCCCVNFKKSFFEWRRPEQLKTLLSARLRGAFNARSTITPTCMMYFWYTLTTTVRGCIVGRGARQRAQSMRRGPCALRAVVSPGAEVSLSRTAFVYFTRTPRRYMCMHLVLSIKRVTLSVRQCALRCYFIVSRSTAFPSELTPRLEIFTCVPPRSILYYAIYV